MTLARLWARAEEKVATLPESKLFNLFLSRYKLKNLIASIKLLYILGEAGKNF